MSNLSEEEIKSKINFLEQQIKNYKNICNTNIDGNTKTLYRSVIVKNQGQLNELRLLYKIKKNRKKKEKIIKRKIKNK
jgi:hypothetical protein